ncbi:putative aspartate kinase [Rosa chinensis]|uniref:Putative aspartate kinase n=1 Tax=Rosa chinensis TaxID=74649 RepID=A0A2P6PB88_ROSCH|nr:putative aspartate kinase [Rosa chinensis]
MFTSMRWSRADSIILEVMDLIKGWISCAVTTLGRDGSDLTATTIGKARWQELDHVVEELEKIVVVNLQHRSISHWKCAEIITNIREGVVLCFAKYLESIPYFLLFSG